ncbi:MAG: hypothetical protein AAF408_18605, partial [Pseudomonadota bacterium]
MTRTVVNSWNEWDPLKHVIVGRADDCHIPPEEPALDAKVPEDSDMRGQWGRRPQETIDRANDLLDRFADQLRDRGVRVDRPKPLDHSQSVTTPDFHTDSQFESLVLNYRQLRLLRPIPLQRERLFSWRLRKRYNMFELIVERMHNTLPEVRLF